MRSRMKGIQMEDLSSTISGILTFWHLLGLDLVYRCEISYDTRRHMKTDGLRP